MAYRLAFRRQFGKGHSTKHRFKLKRLYNKSTARLRAKHKRS